VWDSQVASGADLSVAVPAPGGDGWTEGAEWTNGGTYYAWVDVQQDGGLWSASTKDNATFTISWTPPAAPSSVTAANQTSGPLLVTVAGVTGVDAVQVQSSTDDGTSWSEVATAVPSGSAVTVQRPTRYGVDVRFRARTADTIDGMQLWSAWTAMAADVTPTDRGAYLIDPDDGADWLAIRVRQDAARERVQGVSVWYGAGADRAVVDRAPAAGWAGKTTLLVSTAVERAALLAWLDSHPTFWLHWNPERYGASTTAEEPTLMALSDSVSLARPREVPIAWVEQ
jgi:hypothetical protein